MAKKTIKKKTTKKKSFNNFSKYIRGFWILFGVGLLSAVLIFQLAAWEAFGPLPSIEDVTNPKTNLASQIISSDSKLIAKYYFNDNRTPVEFNDLPKNLVDALVATEDIRFYDHSGIDARGTLRAFAFLGGRGGGSTITQQLSRQLFVGVRSRNKFQALVQKIKEYVISIRLERQYTKEEILTMYFNVYDWGNNADGIRSAAKIYFGKEPKELDVKESAMLVGMFVNSSFYNPRRNPVGTKNRRNVVLDQMAKNDFITELESDSLKKTELDLNYTPESHKEGLATYFRMHLKEFMDEWIEENPMPDGSKYNLYNSGLKIYTTIDSRMQQYAENAVRRHMPKLQAEFDHQNTPDRNPTAPFLDLEPEEIKRVMNAGMRQSERWRHMKYDLKKSDAEIVKSFDVEIPMTIFSWQGEIDTIMKPMDSMRYYKQFLHPGMMSMDPQTGHVKAWVGGMDYKHFQYDHVEKGKRQVGSTFKPIVYATAIDQLQLSPCDTFPKQQITIEANKYGNPEPWTARNSNGDYNGYISLISALANSVNTVTARLMDKVGPEPVVEMARNLGIKSDVPPVPAIALGTPDLSVYEMVAAYSTFANKGVYNKPVLVTRIEDKNGTVLYQFKPESRDVLSEEVAYVTVNLMQGVVRNGSGARLRHNYAVNNTVFKEVVTGYPYELDYPIAGKTGTTQNQSDGWFMGMVPNLVTGVWVGAEDRAAHFSRLEYGQGAAMALPIWALYMKACFEDPELNISKEDFERPSKLSINVDCSTFGDGMTKDKKEDELEDVLDF